MMVDTQDIQVYEGDGTELALARDPDKIIEEAIAVSKRLKDIVVKTKAAIKLGESEHLKFEAWQTLAHFYGLIGRIRETRFVTFGEVTGFHAFADLVHVKSGRIVSSAEAMCLDDEEKWSERTKYQYAYVLRSGGHLIEDPGKDEIIWEDNPYKPGKKRPKKERVKVGMEQVPAFQLMSMAQTRALSKVHSAALRWIVVLAGFSPTPAEETEPVNGQSAPSDEDYGYGNPPPPIQQPKKASKQKPQNQEQSPGSIGGPDGTYITQKQANDLWQLGYEPNDRRSGLTKDQIVRILRACGYESVGMILQSDYDRVSGLLRTGEEPEPPATAAGGK
jgi:hypothetical protein